MEFKYRAIDEQASAPYLPNQSSSFSYFAGQAVRAGYSSTNFRGAHEFFPNHVGEVVQREIEKQRIREEIIATEIVRKRILEAEVRREMQMEREMALRRGENFSVRLSSSSLTAAARRFEPKVSALDWYEGRTIEERLGLSLEERLGYSVARRAIGEFETVPFQRSVALKISDELPFHRGVEPMNSETVRPRPSVELSELKPVSEVSKEKEKVIFLVSIPSFSVCVCIQLLFLVSFLVRMLTG
ncbi:unnamed protein product [Ilex paraguariensis]|uniref:Uncharacterized protein n=1 Tax=Ilex paraguariensis TaxID=185542 RepID=A0ABC8TIR4_9AQUA